MTEVSGALKRASQHHRANRLAEAEQIYREVLQTQPRQPEALYGLAVLALQTGKHRVAEQMLQAAQQVAPDSAQVWFTVGNLRQSQGRLGEAVRAYQRALALEPAAAAYNQLGVSLQRQGKLEEAVRNYQSALEVDPSFLEANVNLGNVLFAQGKLSRAQQTHYAKCNNDLGVMQKKAGNLNKAVAFLRQAIALDPELPIAYYNLAGALHEQGHYQKALDCYQQALALGLEDDGYLHDITIIYRALL